MGKVEASSEAAAAKVEVGSETAEGKEVAQRG